MTAIAIDYTPAIRQQAGIGRIIRGQVQALVEANPGYDLRLFVVGRVSDADRRVAPLPPAGTPIDERNMVRLWHRLNLPYPRVETFTGGPLDLLHATDFVLPPSRARHKLLTVHDLAFLFYPDAAMPGLQRYLNVVVPRSVARADHILADSHNTAMDLQNEWNVAPERITVVQGAVEHTRFRPLHDAAGEARVRTRYGIGEDPFILGLSRLEPRKNFARLIQAFAQARAEVKLPHKLIIGGSKGWLYDEIFASVQSLGVEEWVHFPGFIDDVDLPLLYNAAEFFAYPSLYEGFGLPIVEALACGTPVLAGDNSCLPEAGGPGALYVDAESVDSIAAGLLRLAQDDDLRAELRRAGLAHAARFTWARSAQQLLDAYAKFTNNAG
jgi:glycosyltransferase involved in cell wall biosynthesis